MACASVIHRDLDVRNGDLNYLLNNWRNNAIVDISIMTGNEECPEGNEIFFFDWQGTKEGCFCDDFMTILNRKCCGKNETSCIGCKGQDIKPILSRKLY